MATTTAESTRPPQAGDPAIDAEFLDSEGMPVSLSSLWNDRPLVIVFLRHLGCTFCRQQLAWLRRDYPKIAEQGASLVCVAQGVPAIGKAYVTAFGLQFPLLLCGDDLTVYRQYGLIRGRLIDLLNPAVLIRGIVSIFQGYKQTEVIGDAGQLGGAFLVDTAGIVRFAHRNKDASDNVDNNTLVSEIKRLRS